LNATPSALAVAFHHSDEASASVKPRVSFRAFDAASWSAGGEVTIETQGDRVFGFAAGASVSGGKFAGAGYGVAWRARLEPLAAALAEPHVAVLDGGGHVVLGPIAAAPKRTYPGEPADIVWSGESYLVAVPTEVCPESPPCQPYGFRVSRLTATGLEPVSNVKPIDETLTPRRPLLAAANGTVFLAWSEGSSDAKTPRTIGLAWLDPAGKLLGRRTVGSAVMTAALTLSAGAEGAVLTWGVAGDAALPATSPGHSRLVVRHIGLDGADIQPPVTLDLTEPHNGWGAPSAAIASPRGVLLSWPGASTTAANHAVTYLARLDCAP
jgi:hypothetical protein